MEHGDIADQPGVNLLADLFMQRKSGILNIETGEEIIHLYFYQGEVIGGYSNQEEYEIKKLLIQKKNPAYLVLENLKNHPGFDPFLPLKLVEKGVLTLEELLSYSQDQVKKMITHVLTLSAGTFLFTPCIPKKAIHLHLSLAPFIEWYIQSYIPLPVMEKNTSRWFHEPMILIQENLSLLGLLFYQTHRSLLKRFHAPASPSTILEKTPEGEREKILRFLYMYFTFGLIRPVKLVSRSANADWQNEQSGSPSPEASLQSPRKKYFSKRWFLILLGSGIVLLLILILWLYPGFLS